MNKNKVKRGRPQGSLTCVPVTLARLQKVAGPNTKIFIYGKQAKSLGIHNKPTQAKELFS